MANIKSINGNPIVVGTSGIEDNAVTTAKLAQGAVTTAKLANGAVTDAKLAQSGGVLEKVDTKAPAITDTASGAIASFDDGADDMPVKKLVANIEPVQDLHGYENPWPAGGGKNLCPPITLPITSGTVLREFPEEITLTSLSLQFRFSGSFSNIGGSFLIGRDANGTDTFTITPGYMKKVSDNTALIANTTYNNEAVSFSASNLGASGKLKRILFYNYPSFTDGVFTDLMLEDSATPTTYAPYSNICPISGWTGAEIVGTGKNLFDMHIAAGDAEKNIILDRPLYGYISFSAKNNNVVLSEAVWRIKLTTKSGDTVYIGDTGAATRPMPITRPFSEDDPIVKITCRSDTMVSGSYDFQIERGPAPTDYEPFGNQISVTFPTEAGTVYGGTLTLNPDRTGTLVVNRGFTTFNGSEGWNSYAHDNHSRFGLYFAQIAYTTTNNVISNRYKAVSPADTYLGVLGISGNSSSNFIFVCDEMYADAVAFKAALAANNLEVVYPLASPRTFQLTAEQVSGILTTLYGTNNIWADTGDVEVTYPVDTKLYIDSKITQAIANALNS